MNYDEFAFFNQQLAAMLSEGIPLEGALKQLCAGMRSGLLRAEVEALESDLAKGTPLKQAMASRRLPEFYARMVEIGARSNDLPGVLTLLADHYHRTNALWTRLKGLMVYPLLVLLVALGLTVFISMAFSRFLAGFAAQSVGFSDQAMPSSAMALASIWMPPLVLSGAALLVLGAVFIPSWRARLRWRLPAFKEASLAQLASAIALMLKNGTTLPEALALAEALESNTPAGKSLAQWRQILAAGGGKPAHWLGRQGPFPPLFLWLVQQGGEDVASGFQKAAEIYRARASYRVELALYGALPISILVLGQMVFWQAAPLMRTMVWLMNTLGGPGDVIK
jgi:type II secretory pathway component PulF